LQFVNAEKITAIETFWHYYNKLSF